MASFAERVDVLKQLVGDGDLAGQVDFDQVYAYNQHEGGWLDFMGKYGPKRIHDHPGGGHSKFLTTALTHNALFGVQRLADHVLDDEEGSLIRAMADNAEKIAADASAGAPIEFGDLKESDHPRVYDDGILVYDRPPGVPRLSEAQLREKDKLPSPTKWRWKGDTFSGGDGRRTYLEPSNPRHGLAHPHHGGPHIPKPQPVVDRRSERPHDDDEGKMLERIHHQQFRRSLQRVRPLPGGGLVEEQPGVYGWAPDLALGLRKDDADRALSRAKRRRKKK